MLVNILISINFFTYKCNWYIIFIKNVFLGDTLDKIINLINYKYYIYTRCKFKIIIKNSQLIC